MGGYDCSSLMQAAYASAGVTPPRTTQEQYGAFPLLAAGTALEPGDLVYFGSSPSSIGHDGIYIGGGTSSTLYKASGWRSTPSVSEWLERLPGHIAPCPVTSPAAASRLKP